MRVGVERLGENAQLEQLRGAQDAQRDDGEQAAVEHRHLGPYRNPPAAHERLHNR
jgi:hypothetical protein